MVLQSDFILEVHSTVDVLLLVLQCHLQREGDILTDSWIHIEFKTVSFLNSFLVVAARGHELLLEVGFTLDHIAVIDGQIELKSILGAHEET